MKNIKRRQSKLAKKKLFTLNLDIEDLQTKICNQIRHYIINKEVVTLVSLFTLALVLRLNNLNADPYGDEAFYYYLTKYPQNYFVNPKAPGHPPLLYILYHLFSQKLMDFRLINILIGTLIPCIVYLILDTKKVNYPFKVLASSFLIFNYLFVKYSSFVFLDMLGTFFALIALLFYLRRNNKTYVVSLFLSLTTKEYFIIFALSMIGSIFLKKHNIHKPTVIALSLFGLWTLANYFITVRARLTGLPPFPLSGHAYNPLSLDALNTMFISIFFIPIIAFAFKKENLELFAASSAYPLFLCFWGNTEEWYLLLPIAINVCLIALALDRVLKSFRFSNKIKSVFIIILLLCSSYLFLSSSISEIKLTENFIQTYQSRELMEASGFLKTHFSNQDIIMIDCFWAYSDYPIGEFMHMYGEYWSSQENLADLQSKINQTGLCLLGKEYSNATVNLALQESFKKYIVFDNSVYMIIAIPNA